MKLRFAHHPDRLTVKHPILIGELLELEENAKQLAVSTIIGMLRDPFQHGRQSQFREKLIGIPLWELKPNVRGGEKGGSRVYLFLLEDDTAGIVNCEPKDGVSPSQAKLYVGLQVLRAYKSGIPVFKETI